MLKHYLDGRKISYAPKAERKDLLDLVKEYCASSLPLDFGPLPTFIADSRALLLARRPRRDVVPVGDVVGRRAARVGRQGEARRRDRRLEPAPSPARAARQGQLRQDQGRHVVEL